MNKIFKKIFAFALTIFFTLLVIKNVSAKEAVEAFREFDTNVLFFAIPLFIAIMFLRTLRWEVFLPDVKASGIKVFGLYMLSSLLNIFLPARAGDIFRGYMYGERYGVAKSEVLGTIAAERIVDGLTVVFILGFGAFFYYKNEIVTNMLYFASLLFFGGFCFACYISKEGKAAWFCDILLKISKFFPKKIENFTENTINPIIKSFVSGFKPLCNPKKLAIILLFSAIAWGGDCVFIYLLIKGFNISVPFHATYFAVTFTALSTVVPQASVYIGLYWYAFVEALAIWHADKSVALSAAVAWQIIMLVTFAVVSLVFVVCENGVDLKKYLQGEKND